MNTKQKLLTLAFATGFAGGLSAQNIVIDTAQVGEAIGTGGPEGNADYYGSGADDGFEEYGIAGFNTSSGGGQFTSSAFGFTVADITQIEYTLTVNDRTFSDGDQVEFVLSTDAFDGNYSGLSFDSTNFPVTGLDPSQYTAAPISLGTYSLTADISTLSGGSSQSFDFSLSSAAETALIDSINNGTEFNISIHATGVNDDVTFSGVGNTFDPGDPSLSIEAVPEPEFYGAFVGLLAIGFAVIRRRRA